MDPLSITSGVVGILAFAIQMAQMASKVKDAMAQFRTASAEADELFQRLAMLDTVCALVQQNLTRRHASSEAIPPSMLTAVSGALLQCHKKMEGLDKTLSAMSSTKPSKVRSWSSKSEALSRARFVFSRDKIRSMVQDVGDAMSLLQFIINVDMWASMQAARSSQHSENRALHQNGHARMTTRDSLMQSSSSLATMENPRRPQHRRRRPLPPGRLLSWETVEPTSADSVDGPSSSIKVFLTVRLPLTSLQIEFCYNSSLGTPSCAMNITHIIDQHSILGDHVFDSMSSLPELQRLLSERKISIYSLVGDLDLFWLAMSLRCAEILRFLLEHDYENRFLDGGTPKDHIFIIKGRSIHSRACEATEILLSLRIQDNINEDISFLLRTIRNTAYYELYLERFLALPAIDSQRCVANAWRYAVEDVVRDLFFGICGAEALGHWSSVFRSLVEKGVDVHQPVFPDDGHAGSGSAYMHIICAADDAFVADEYVHEWLTIIEASGVPIQSYIKREIEDISRHWDDWNDERSGMDKRPRYCANLVRRRLEVISFHGLPALSWRWSYSSSASAFEVLEEFQNFGPRGVTRLGSYHFPATPENVQTWMRFADGRKPMLYPFTIRALDCLWAPNPRYYGFKQCQYDSYKLASDIRSQRFVRRQAKKWKKANLGKKSLAVMPGSWVD